MKECLIEIWYRDPETGERVKWIRVGTYDDPKHPNRKFCYDECNPQTIWFNDAKTLEDVMSYLWREVIPAECVAERGFEITVQRPKEGDR